MKHVIIWALLIAASTSIEAQTTNFSGTWKLNKAQSDFGNMSSNSAPVEMKINQDNRRISVKRKQLYASGDSTVYVENLNLDGKTSETTIKAGLTKTTTIKWLEDKSKLLDEATYSSGQQAKSYWTLSENGKILTLLRELVEGDRIDNTVYVYEKQ